LDYLKWKSSQIEATVATRKPPTMMKIVTTLQKTTFSDNSSIGKLFDILFADGSTNVPIASSSNLKLALRPSLNVLDTFPEDPTLMEPLSDEKPPDFDPPKYEVPTFSPYLVSLTPSVPLNPKLPEPIYPAIALQLGNLIFTAVSSPQKSDWADSSYILLLNSDLSLWIVFNYTPYDSLGQRAPIPVPTKMDPKSCFPSISDDTPFDVAMLLSGADVRKWDPAKVGSADDLIRTVLRTKAMCGLMAKPAEQVDLAVAGLGKLKVEPGVSGQAGQ
jgi:hypothetical protein